MSYKKYFCLSFDDGLEQDKKIIKILKEYGLKGCTFNLNGGLMGQKKAIGRIGDIGFTEKEDLALLKKKGLFVHYTEDYRIPADEIAQVYEGFEVASHAYRHENLKKLSAQQLDETIRQDVECLKGLTGQEIMGFAYPFGAVSEEAVSVLKKYGIRYARTTGATKKFVLPKDPYRLDATCLLIQKDVLTLARQFIDAPPTEADQLFYVWGHGYELDFGTKNSNWEKFRKLCDMMAGAGDVISLPYGWIN